MKAIVLPESASDLLPECPMLAPDSALGRNRLPVFLPDEYVQMRTIAFLGVRMSRLGKNILERFASRYYDALSLACLTLPADTESVTPLSLAKDYAAVIGDWIGVDSFRGRTRLDIHFVVGQRPSAAGSETGTGPIYKREEAFNRIDRLVSRLSCGMTFKTGDIILLGLGGITTPAPDLYIRGSVDGIESLNFHYK